MPHHPIHKHAVMAFGATVLLMASTNVYAVNPQYKTYHTQQRFNARINVSMINGPLLNEAICHETNVRRVKHGRKALPISRAIEKAAQLHADLMVRDAFYSHYHPSLKAYKNPSKRFRIVGILNPKASENIAAPFAHPTKKSLFEVRPGKFSATPHGPIVKPHTYVGFAREALNQWMNSPGHRKNILSKTPVSMGCAASFYLHGSLNIPAFKAVQNFQHYKPVKVGTPNYSLATVQARTSPQGSLTLVKEQKKTTRRGRVVITKTTKGKKSWKRPKHLKDKP